MIAKVNRNYIPAYWDDFFNDKVFNQLNTKSSNGTTPAVNVTEDEKGYSIEVVAPGFAREDFILEIEKDLLTISTEQEDSDEEQKQNFLRREFNLRSFKRSFQLPETVDQDLIEATHKRGILTLTLPKKAEEIQKAPRQIAVN